MDFYLKLPRNKKEFALFIAIISIISVNIIAPLITFFETEFSLSIWYDTLKVIPFIWLCVVALVLLTYKPAEFFTNKLVKNTDSFYPHIIINAMITVFMMSIFLTVIGTWIGTRHISIYPVLTFFYKWPRNFSIALAVEILVAQPFARFVITKLHLHNEKNKAVA